MWRSRSCLFTLIGTVGIAILIHHLHIPLPAEMSDRWRMHIFELCARVVYFYPVSFLHMQKYFPVPPMSERFQLQAFKHVGVSWQVVWTRFTVHSFCRVLSWIHRLKERHNLKVEDVVLGGVPCRVYIPESPDTDAAIVFIHGGGFVLLNVPSYDLITRLLAKVTNMVTISVEYRLAPEHRFPSAVDDSESVILYLLSEGYKRYNFSANKLTLMGDSAGGNLAAVVTQRLRNKGVKPTVKLQVLIYPLLQFSDFLTPSYQLAHRLLGGTSLPDPESIVRWSLLYFGIDPMYTPKVLKNMHVTESLRSIFERHQSHDVLPSSYRDPSFYNASEANVLPADIDYALARMMRRYLLDWQASPLIQPDMSGLPPALIVTTQFDPLRDDGYWYAVKLRKAGVDVTQMHYERGFHAMLNLHTEMSIGRKAIHDIGKFIRSCMASSEELFRSFLTETEEDLKSPTTSVFFNQIGRYRLAVQEFTEAAEGDFEVLCKFRKCLKVLLTGQDEYIRSEESLAEALCALAAVSNPNSCVGESDPEISAAWLKFSVMFKELARAGKIFQRNSHNCLMLPLVSLLKGESRGKISSKQADKAFRDYQTKLNKLEKDAKSQSGGELCKLSQVDLSEALLRERTILQYELCQLFLKSSKMQLKGGVGLAQATVELYYAVLNYFRKSLQIVEDLKGFVETFEASLNETKQRQENEHRTLQVLCRTLKKSSSLIDYDAGKTDDSHDSSDSLSVTVLESGTSESSAPICRLKSGYLLKRSKRRMNRNWYRRRCEVRDGFFYIWHDNESLPPIQINLLTCQVLPNRDDSRMLIVQCHDRKYEFQAESDSCATEWITTLSSMKKLAEKEAMSDEAVSGEHIQKLALDRIKSLPGNDRCCDCGSTKDVTWLCTNFGSLHCIDCAGSHRDLGVHVSRIQSLSLDRIDRATALIPLALGNHKVNMVFEATYSGIKIMDSPAQRKRFIHDKYVQRKYVLPVVDRPMEYLVETIALGSVSNLLHLYASGVDLNTVVDPTTGENALLMTARADVGGSHLAFLQFLLQNGADVNATNLIGETAAHVCVRQNKPECLKLLLMTWNIDLQIRDVDGCTPMQLAKRMQRESCERLIVKFDENSKSNFADVEVPLSLLNDAPEESSQASVAVPVATRGSAARTKSITPQSVRSISELSGLISHSADPLRSSAYFDSIQHSRTAKPVAQKSHTLARVENNRPSCSDFSSSGRGIFSSFQQKIKNDKRPKPAPRKVKHLFFLKHILILTGNSLQAKTGFSMQRKCRALYNCEADNPDEISFKKGDEIVVTREHLSGENDCWMEGFVLDRPDEVGRFPTSFVTFEKE
ncbi:hydrolase, alpha/beta domain protein [Trichuris suis]|nr:hydrolase, alpha/beta domain protein [Trichuris suis]